MGQIQLEITDRKEKGGLADTLWSWRILLLGSLGHLVFLVTPSTHGQQGAMCVKAQPRPCMTSYWATATGWSHGLWARTLTYGWGIPLNCTLFVGLLDMGPSLRLPQRTQGPSVYSCCYLPDPKQNPGSIWSLVPILLLSYTCLTLAITPRAFHNLA